MAVHTIILAERTLFIARAGAAAPVLLLQYTVAHAHYVQKYLTGIMFT